MKVAVLNDLPVAGTGTSGFGSGAELTIGRFVQYGHAQGHQVDVVCPEFCSDRILEAYDVVISKNVTAFPREFLAKMAQRPYVTWASDYAWTRWRLYFAFQESQRRVPDLPFWRDFFLNSTLNVFLSPLHRRAYEWMMPELEGHPNYLSPPPVDEAAFRPAKEGWIENTGATVNGLLDFKGLHLCLKFMEEHPDIQFTSIGNIREAVNLPANVKHVGVLPPAEVARVLSRTEVYVELPRTIQPYNQTGIQGLLACKRVITNELLGAASWPWFQRGDREEARRVMREAMPRLWERLAQEAAA